MKNIQNEQWINALPEEAVNIAEEINIGIARIIAERIKAIGELTPSDIKKLTNSLQYLGADLKKITKLIAEYSERGQKATVNALKQAADGSDEFAKVLYAARGMSAYSWRNDLYLHRLVSAMAKQTGAQFTNLSQTLAYKINNQTISLRRMYTRAIDKAIYEVQSGTVDYHTAMRKTVKELSNNMRYVHWESGHTRRLDSHVRQNLIDGIKQLQTEMLDYHGQQFGADGVELSAHAICAPDHLAVQGRQFSNEEFEKMQNGLDFEDVNGNEYKGFPRPIGQWNCRHIRFPIIIGISKPAHSEEQLKQYAENSREKYNLTQQQRAMETKLRQLKTERLAASAAGDEFEAKRIQRKINEQQAAYRQFSAKNNLLYDTRRASVEGYRRISAKLPSVSEKAEGNITFITDSSIDSVKKIQIGGYTASECEFIQSKHKELLTYSRDNNESKECAFILEKDLSSIAKDIGNESELEFTNPDCVFMLYNRPRLFVMHNHPKNGSFSDRDIRFFIENENVKHLSIVKNNGKVEVLTKKDGFDILKVEKNLRRAFKNNIKQNTELEITKSISDFLTKSKEMIEWAR